MFIMVLNFGFKIYLAREFPQEDLVVYYTITDVFSVIGRIFVGYKDALTTLYNQTFHKLKILRTWSVFFFWVIVLFGLVVIPAVFHLYIVEKVPDIQIDWWHMTMLFVTMNFVSFYGYLFLVTKHYKLISINDMLKTVAYITTVLSLYRVWGMPADHRTLVDASIVSNLLVLVFLLYKQRKYLPRYHPGWLFGLKFARFGDDTNRRFVWQTILASSNYFVYGLLLFAPVYTLLQYASVEKVAEFQVVARSIYFALVAIFSWPLGRFIFPEFSSLLSQKKFDVLEQYRAKFVRSLVLFGVVAIGGCWLFSKWIVSLLFPVAYAESYQMLDIMIVALPFVMYQNISESVIKAAGYYRELIGIKGFGLLLYIISYVGLQAVLSSYLASVYAFIIGIIGIAVVSLYYEKSILNEQSIERNR